LKISGSISSIKIEKVRTGIMGLDFLLNGGYNEGSINLISGGTGTGKTLFALSFIHNGAKEGKNGIFVTFEESRKNILQNLLEKQKDLPEMKGVEILDISAIRRSFNLDKDKKEKFSFMDVDAICELIRRRAIENNAKRIAIDGIGLLWLKYPSQSEYRAALFRLATEIRKMKLTTVVTTEIENKKKLSRYGVEEFIADSVTILAKEGSKRTIKIHKMRGENHAKGEHRFKISDEIIVYPTLEPKLRINISSERVTTGVEGIDKMTCGGFFRGDTILLTGPSGTGKTIFAIQFAISEQKGRSLYVTLNEPEIEIKKRAHTFGVDLDKKEKEGRVEFIDLSNSEMNPSEHAYLVLEKLNGVSRVVIDSLTDYPSLESYEMRSLFSSLIFSLKSACVTTLLLADTPEIIGKTEFPTEDITDMCDAILMMRYVEVGSEIKRAINVFKMRGTEHNRSIVEYRIGKKGIEIHKKFDGLEGIMTGLAKRNMFDESLSVAKEIFRLGRNNRGEDDRE